MKRKTNKQIHIQQELVPKCGVTEYLYSQRLDCVVYSLSNVALNYTSSQIFILYLVIFGSVASST